MPKPVPKKRLPNTVVFTAAFVAFFAWSFAAQAASMLVRGNHQDPASLDPHRISTVYESNIVLDLFEGLTAPDATGAPGPGVAQTWSVSKDGLTWTFTLWPDLEWSDGAPLLSGDVVFSFQRLVTPATASQYPYLFYAVKNAAAVNRGEVTPDMLGVSAPNSKTVVVQLESPVPFLPELLANAFAAIVPAHTIEAYGDRWASPGVMVSNGAFALKDFKPQDRVHLIRNPYFRDAGSVALDSIVYLPTEDQSAAVARFRAGGLDTSLEFPTARTPWLLENLPNETRISEYLVTFYLSFNTDSPALSDARVRRALSLAIDRETIARRVLRSGEKPAYTLVPPSVAGYTPPDVLDSRKPKADRIAEAKSLLEDAGYGPEKRLSLSYSLSSAEDRRRVAVAISAMWRPLGVDVMLNNTEGKVLFARLRTGDFEIGYAGWVADVNDAGNFLSILDSRAKNSNYARFNSRAYDALLDQAAETIDLSERASVLAEAEALMLSETPIAPLFYGVSKSLVGSHVSGWIDNPRDVHLSRYVNVARRAALND